MRARQRYGDIGADRDDRGRATAEVADMMWGWETGGGWLMMGLGMFIWVALIALVVWLVIRASGQRQSGGGAESAEALLRRRFASGEIDADEYQSRLEALRRR
jgi:putative membrane protein